MAQPGYPSAQPGYPPAQPGYPPAQPGYPPQQQYGGPGYMQPQQPGFGAPMVPGGGYPQQPGTPMGYGAHPPGQMGPHGNSKFELGISCRKLKDTDFLSKSDPLCILYINNNGRWDEVGKTEMIKNTQDPSWQKKFIIDYKAQERQLLRFDIFDWDSKSNNLKKHDYLARMECTMAQIVAAPNKSFVSVVNHGPSSGAQFIINAEQVVGGNQNVKFQLAARGLDKKDKFGKSDPFFILSKMSSGGQLTRVKTSEVIKNDLNPTWAPMSLSVSELCNNDYNKPLKIDVYDSDGNGKHDLIGSFTTNLMELSKAQQNHQSFYCVNPKKQSKRGYSNSGEVQVKYCRIEKH